MGKGRDKRKKHEDPEKALERARRQEAKKVRNLKDPDAPAASATGGLDGEEDIAVTVAKLRKAEEKRKEVIERELPGNPSPRANAVLSPHPIRADLNEVVVFGGEFWDGVDTKVYNDLLIYNPQRAKWRQIITAGGPPPRSSAQGFIYKQYLYIVGGEMVSRTQAQFHHYRDTWRIHMDTCVWDELCTQRGAPVPSARSGHRVALWRRNAVLFGGFYDNAQESRYYNDTWVLSDLDGVGHWQQILTPSHSEVPHPRSGHAVAVYDDKLFVYGGYSTEKLNRFHKTTATVHRDLWTLPLGSPTPVWTKIKLGGIPPPIRSGIGFAAKEKKLYLFGGVVDIDAPGGRTNSSFENDLFVLHLDSMKFFPLVLRKKGGGGKTASTVAAGDAGGAGSLKAELEAEVGGRVSLDDEDDEWNDDPVTFGAGSTGAAAASAANPDGAPASIAPAPDLRTSHITLPSGQVLPCRRMNAAMVIVGNNLVLFGGQYEVGKKEVSLMDLYALNLNRMDTYQCLVEQDLTAFPWQGHDSDSDAGSWEDGSTVADLDELLHDEEEEEMDDEDGDDDDVPAAAAGGAAKSGDDDEDDAPHLVPANRLASAVAAAAAAGTAAVEGRKKVQGKTGMQNHKAQLEAQLSANAAVPTPLVTETLREFFLRTEAFWIQNARESGAVDLEGKSEADAARELRPHALSFCRLRYDEAIQLIEQLEKVAQQERLEKEQLRRYAAERRRLAEEEAAAAAKDDEDDDDDA